MTKIHLENCNVKTVCTKFTLHIKTITIMRINFWEIMNTAINILYI